MAAAQRIFDLLDTEPRVVEAAKPVEIKSFENEIVFDKVGFEYNTGEAVLKEISFRVKKGQIVAVVDASGRDKSTLVDLFCRFHDAPQQRDIVSRHIAHSE